MTLTPQQWVNQHHGSAHSSALRNAGFSTHQIGKAVDQGELLRVRRSWLITPDCDPRIAAAARVGGRLTCVSAAAVMGLWDVAPDKVHVALPRTASRFDPDGIVVHCSTGPVPVAARAARDPLLNVLFQVAQCAPRDEALAIWESAVRQDLIDLDVLERVVWRSRAASDIARLTGSRSDSGKESRFVWLMREIGVDVRQQAWVDGHPLDGLIGNHLGIQIDGFAHHSSPRDRRRDIRADGRLTLRGYTVLRFDAHQVDHDPLYVQRTVQDAMAQGLHL